MNLGFFYQTAVGTFGTTVKMGGGGGGGGGGDNAQRSEVRI